jgi:hypothetical protein
VRTLAEATVALEYFNAFHDGFIRELTLRSHDRFEARGVHAMSGRLDLDIRFAHYNYREGEPPADQMIRATFRQVRDLETDIPHWHGEWSIDRVEIERALRRAGAGQESVSAGTDRAPPAGGRLDHSSRDPVHLRGGRDGGAVRLSELGSLSG